MLWALVDPSGGEMFLNLCQFSEEYLSVMLVMAPAFSFGRTFGMEIF
jgi:hypothetical protein